jgi:hypothetical protein
MATKMLNAFSFWTITILSLVASHMPGLAWVFAPINIFTTTVHEMGHALVCLATGGTVSGLTIVADGAGHGGLTFCQGGNQFLISQAGYLGAAIFGSFLIVLSQYPKLSTAILVGSGFAIACASILLMPGTLFQPGMFLQGLGSIAWALALACALIWSGFKLKSGQAHLVVLFLAVQTALNSLTCIGDLIGLSLGMSNIHAFSDASTMANMTGIPAFIWSIFWGLAALAIVGITLKETYGKRLLLLGKK